MNKILEINDFPEYSVITFDTCSNDILIELINDQIQFVWCVNHFLEDNYNWVKRKINLSERGPLHDVLVRGVTFDFFMETKDYLKIYDEFRSQGNILIQCNKLIPQSLNYLSLPEDQRTKILIKNGMYSEFFLPHIHEVATFTCTDKEYVHSIADKFKK